MTLYLALFVFSLTSWPMPLAYLAAALILILGLGPELAPARAGRHRSRR